MEQAVRLTRIGGTPLFKPIKVDKDNSIMLAAMRKAFIETLDRNIAELLQNTARVKQYTSVESFASYANAEGPYKAEAMVFCAWRSDMYAMLYGDFTDRVNALTHIRSDADAVKSYMDLLPKSPFV